MTRSALSSLALLALVAGCGGGGTGGQSVVEQAAAGDDDSDDITINVVSRAFADATIYLEVGGSKRRLGTAQGKSTTVFSVPWNRVARISQVQLRADPLGDEADLVTDLVNVVPGSQLVWTLEVHGHSGVDVY